jgi:3-hydroxymyristoyl/3-hydroxydecanoyl-(acyl carrier protein) dehydratase
VPERESASASAGPGTADDAGDAHFHIAADHATFAGHFPGHPVLPGVALLSLVMQAVAGRPALAARLGATPRVDNAKFLRPVGPGATLRVALREQGAGVAFEVHSGDSTVARGQLAAGAPA